MRKGLSRIDVARYHKWLAQDIPVKAIAKRLHTTLDVLDRLSPEKWAAAEKKRKDIEVKAQKERIDNRKKADILVETAARVMSGDKALPEV